MRGTIWYASYGSNLSRRRFERYLRGGTPRGGRRRYPGARDPRPPSGDRPVSLPYRLRFAGESHTWGGGMAFVDVSSDGQVLARAYRITIEQFADIHAQENAGAAEPTDLSAVLDGQQVVAGRGNYPVIVRCGRLGSTPMFTFTAQHAARHAAAPNAPAPAYLRTIATGLAEAHALDAEPIVDYLRRAPAVDASYDADTLSAVVSAGVAATAVPATGVVEAMVAPPRHSSPS